MYTSHVTPQPKGLSIMSEGIQAKHPNTAVTAHGDLWNHPCRSISQSFLKTPVPFPALFSQILPSVGELHSPISQTRKSKAQRSQHLQPKVTPQERMSEHRSRALPQEGSRLTPRCPGPRGLPSEDQGAFHGSHRLGEGGRGDSKLN